MSAPEQWSAAGLLRPDSPPGRAELLAWLVEQGCSVEEMVRADAAGRLFALAGDRVLQPGARTLTLREVAERTGARPEEVVRVWRALGLPDRGADVPLASEGDLVVGPAFAAFKELVGDEEALALVRVIGAAVARIADAGDAALRRLADLDLERSADELATARLWAHVAGLVPLVTSVSDVVLRHHVEVARALSEQSASADVADDGLVRTGVGFADLCGFTRLSQQLTTVELSRLVSRFEEASYDAVGRSEGRVVKLIGDAVMWTAPRPAALATIALDLLEAARSAGLRARAGAAHDLVLARDGDVFGPPVNLAARLVGLAEPDQLLVPLALGERLGAEGFGVHDVGPAREVRGVLDPVEVRGVTRR